MTQKTFSSPAHFRQSLENRLQMTSKDTGVDLQRIRRKIAFERFLARLFSIKPYPWVLKGGYALEVRFELSRATKDLDLGTRLKVTGSVEEQKKTLLKELHKHAAMELNDYFLFRIDPSTKLIKSAPDGGFRFSIRSMVAGRLFVGFALDIGMGDPFLPPIEEITGSDWLKPYGIPAARFEAISLEQQFAEKIHAMTIERGERENSRVKDLVDALLLIKNGLNQKRVIKCLESTFNCRKKLSFPFPKPTPPMSWRQPFNEMAVECGLNCDFDTALNVLSSYWD